MRVFAYGTALFITAALTGAGVAQAAPTGGSSAADVIMRLQDAGYNVQINGTPTGSLSACTVTGIHGLTNTDSTGQPVQSGSFTTVYVDIDCPSSNN